MPEKDILQKRCSKCGEWKPRLDFYTSPASWCKQCHSTNALRHYYKSEYAKGARSRNLQREIKRKELQRHRELKRELKRKNQQLKIDSKTKICNGCGKSKPKSMFYRNHRTPDGLAYICILCSHLQARKWQLDNPERYKELANEWIFNNYDKYRDMSNRARLRHRKRYPGRERARVAMTKARSSGLILNHCFWPNCTNTTEIHGHHPHYSKPYEIIPLCKDHHRKLHQLNGDLPFDLPVIDISIYFKKDKRTKPTVDVSQGVGVTT